MSPKIAIALHVDHGEFWSPIKRYILESFRDNKYTSFDLYVTFGDLFKPTRLYWEEQIKNTFQNTTFIDSKNKGRDVGSFISIVNHIIDKGKEYDYIIKLHTKTWSKNPEWSNFWRDEMAEAIFRPDRAGGIESLKILEKYSDVGMVASDKWIFDRSKEPLYLKNNGAVLNYFADLTRLVDRPINLNDPENKFVYGSFFIARMKIFYDFFEVFNIMSYYDDFEPVEEEKEEFGSVTDSWDRLLGFLVNNSKYKIHGLKSDGRLKKYFYHHTHRNKYYMGSGISKKVFWNREPEWCKLMF